MKSILKTIGFYSLPILVIFAFFIYFTHSDKTKIEKTVKQKGGELLSTEQRFVRIGPFFYKDKSQRVYEFKYRINGETKEGWMRTGFINDDYVFDEK